MRIDPVDDERAERDEEPDVEPLEQRVAPEDRELRAFDDVVRDGDGRLGVVLERAAEPEQEDADPDDDPVEHDRRDHLVGADRRLQEPGDARPSSGARRASPTTSARRTCGIGLMPSNDEPIQTATIAPDEVLALAADVEQAAAERERDGEPGEDERRRAGSASAGG